MKQLLLIILLFSVHCVRGQKKIDIPPPSPIPIDSVTKQAIFSQVVRVDSASSEKLLARARSWIVKTYPSANDVIQQYDAAQGLLIAKGMFIANFIEAQPMFNVKTKRQAEIYHTITVESKPGRVRLTINGIGKRILYTIEPARPNQPVVIEAYYPAVGPDALELYQTEKELKEKPMTGEGWAKRNAPIYLYSKRSLDQSLFNHIQAMVSEFKAFMEAKEKDW